MSRGFCSAAKCCAALDGHVRTGLQALPESDRRHIRPKQTRRVAGSVNLDAALADAEPNSPRWDYAIGYRPAHRACEVVHWVEIHPATDGEIRSVEKKLQWLKGWMAENASELEAMEKRFVWISSGKTDFSPGSPGLKRLAQKGCCHVGRVYSIE